MSQTMFRQGDVYFIQADSLPSAKLEKAKRDAQGRVVFAYGEVTGHAHAVETKTGDMFINPADGSRWYLAQADSAVVHEEHGTIVLPAGTVWQVIGQRQYDPFAQENRPVWD